MAQNSQEEFLTHFQSRRIEFPDAHSTYAQVSPGRYPRALLYLFETILSWKPTGERGLYSENCDPSRWGQRLQDPRMNNVQLQGALVQKYLQECGSEIKTGSHSNLLNGLKMLTMTFQPQEHPFFHRVVFHLPGQIKLKGLLALKGDRKKRPFVVVRLGIFSSAEEFIAERYLLMQLFEQSAFNVLMIENMSSPDFIADNDHFAFGGYDEGIQNILIAKLLRDPQEELSSLVESLHFVGVSLGGHGVLYASLLNQLNGEPIESFIGLCPVVHLEPTMHHLNEGGFVSQFVNFWAAQRLAGLRTKVSELQDASSFAFLPLTMEALTKNYHGGLSYINQVKLPEGITDTHYFWKQNEFWDFYHDVKAPVLIFATEQDPAVPFALNSKSLKKKNIKVVSFDEGVHCSLPVPYRWDMLSTLLQSYILSHTKTFKLVEEKMQIDVTSENMQDVKGHVPFKVSWANGQVHFVRIEAEGFHLNLPLSNFDFKFFNKALSISEKEMVERWLHQNLEVKLQNKGEQKWLHVSWKRAA